MLTLRQLITGLVAVAPALALPMDALNAKMVEKRQAMSSSGLTDIDILQL